MDDGTVFDSSKGRQPLEFIIGAGSVRLLVRSDSLQHLFLPCIRYSPFSYALSQVIKGFDTAVTGLAVGESRKSRIPPADAYGETDPAMVMSFPREGKGADGLKEGAKVGPWSEA